MPHAAIAGTRLSATRCDRGRIAREPRAGVTPAVGARSAHSQPTFDLPIGRYLHTTSVTGEHVSRMVVGNAVWPLPNSKEWLSFPRPRVEPRADSRGSGSGSPCRAAFLVAAKGAASGDADVRPQSRARRPDEQMTKLSAMPHAERRAKSTASCLAPDIGVAEVHDSITPANKISYEVTAVTTLEGPVGDGG